MSKSFNKQASKASTPEPFQPDAGDTATHDGSPGDVRDAAGEQAADHGADTAPAADAAPVEETPADTSPEVEALRAELDAVRDQLLRNAAEFQNYRRRTEQEKALLVDYGKSVAVQKLLDVVDDLERSLEAAGQVAGQEQAAGSAFEALHQGVVLVYRKFMEELKRLGVEPIEAVGQPFDENLHEALMQQQAPEGTSAGTVLQELQRGYRMGDRVLRHSKVTVAL